jgi:adenylate cyclase
MKRKISAILAADIVKYSKLVTDDEEQTVGRLAAYRALFEEVTARHGGRIVNLVGDAVLAEFASSVDAVRCAIDVQESTRIRNLAYPASSQMNVRIGITLADIMDEKGELFGDGVNIAARLEGLAPPGGICVSQTVCEQVADKLSVKFEDMGRRRVKNIANPIRAYLIPPRDGSADVGGKTAWLGARPRVRLLATAAAVVLVIAAAAVTLAVRPQLGGERLAAILSGSPAPAVTPVVAARAAVRFDEAKLRALATSQGIPLPRQVKVLLPAASVPASWADYLGGWGGDKRWNSGGRQALLIVESIDEAGTALGIYGQGLPLVVNAANQAPGRFFSFVGAMSDKGLSFAWGSSHFTFRLMPDGVLWGRREFANDQRRFEMAITLERIE